LGASVMEWLGAWQPDKARPAKAMKTNRDKIRAPFL
jgi:hypothetical protein